MDRKAQHLLAPVDPHGMMFVQQRQLANH